MTATNEGAGGLRRWMGGMALLTVAMATAGCVTINAPDKPIVINLNIKIDQEVVYRLDNQAKTVIQQNPGIF
jgi:hypothetical protein